MMIAGGRYACGNPNSIMPIWSNEGRPAGPLNYIQIEDLIAFIRAPSNETYTIRDPGLERAEARPDHGRGQDVQRLGRRQLQAGSGGDAVPGLLVRRVQHPVGRAGRVGCTGRLGWRLGRAGAVGRGLSAAAVGRSIGVARGLGRRRRREGLHRGIGDRLADDRPDAPTAGAPFDLSFDNEDAATPHNFTLKDSTGAVVFKSDTFPGVATRDFPVPALAAGTYPFVCTVHPTMTGTLTVQ